MKIVTLVGLMAVLASGTLCRAEDELSFSSSKQSYVGQGKTLDLTESKGYSFIEDFSTIGVMQFYVSKPGKSSWTLSLATPDGSDFHVGVYDGAQRFPFQDPGHPGIDFYGDGRGYNLLHGWFNVLDFTRENGIITKADVEFYQYGDDYNDLRKSWERGVLHYAACVPEPTALSLAGLGAFALVASRRKK